MYNALIIGSGQIASGYDSPQDSFILTHAHAYLKHEKFNLLGFYDVDFERAQIAAQKWGVKAFVELEEGNDVDVISICSPDDFHLSSIKEALKLNPKLIFLEKPLSDNLDEAKEILEISKNVPILVNYSRRFVPEFQELAQNIKNGLFGDYMFGSGYYGKGFIHNGSHMTNLIELLIGKIDKVDVLEEFEDFYPNDTTKMAVLTINKKKFTMEGIDCRDYTIFEIDLWFKKGRLRILESGQKIEFYLPKESEKYAGYINLELSATINTSLTFAMLNAVDNIYQYLENNEPLKSNVQQAFEATQYG